MINHYYTQSDSEQHHEFPRINLNHTSSRTSLSKVLAWDCFSVQKVKGQGHCYYK